MLLLALLAGREVTIVGLLDSDDLRALRGAVVALGGVVEDCGAGQVRFRPGPRPPQATIHCGQSGTMARLILGVLAALPGAWRLDGAPRLRERPMGPLLDSLRQLGVEVVEMGASGSLPLEIHGRQLGGGRVRVDAGESSQFLSGLLLAGLVASSPIEIEATALTSAPYVDLTLAAATTFGGRIEREGLHFTVFPGLAPPSRVEVEVDASSAVYPAAAAALTGGDVRIEGLGPGTLQGDREAIDLLAAMGATVVWEPGAVRVVGAGLRAIDADFSRFPDQVPTFAALAPFAVGTTRLRGVAHLRIKESDRLAAMRTELTRLGASVVEHEDGLEIPGVWASEPPPVNPVVVDSWDDHRIAMSLALVGLRRPGVAIAEPQVVGKSWPGFWDALALLVAPGQSQPMWGD